MGSIVVLNEQGDITITWDPSDKSSVEEAKKEWESLKEAGYEFFEVKEEKGKRLTRFSAKLGRVIAAPGIQTKKDKKDKTRPKAMAGGPVSEWI